MDSEAAATASGARAVRALRRPSFVPPNALEPLIVVEESLDADEDEDGEVAGAMAATSAAPRDSPSPPPDDSNPYLLSPWRDTRKSSLPTPACSSGITASQVRRLSERGPESGPSPREQEFLATLSAMPGPQPGGRRHSVVISRVPPASLIMFGRGRRESIAAFSAAASRPQALASSTHNLQLDLMDDLLEFKAAKKGLGRRRSEAIGMPSRTREPAAAATPVVNRRKSELPPRITKEFAEEVAQVAAQAAAQAARMEAGIVCSNTDLLHLTGAAGAPGAADDAAAPATTPPTRGSLASLRANSVEAKEAHSVLVTVHGDKAHSSLAAFPTGVRAAPDGVDGSASTASSAAIERRDSEKVLWDERSGSIVDAGLLGSAIEGFLNKDTIAKGRRGAASSVHRATAQLSAWVTAVAIWTPKGAAAAGAAAAPPEAAAADVPGDAVKPAGQDAPAPETPRRRGKMTCDAVCSTLKSLFVK